MTTAGPRGSPLHVAVLFPELLGTYGDGGNVAVLRERLAWRGLAATFLDVGLSDAVPDGCDAYVLGGGEDRAQAQALEALRRTPALARAVGRGAPVLAVCAGLQLLGTSLTDRDGRTTAGLGLLDAQTRLVEERAVGEVVADPDPELALPALVGFANHAGRTRLGPDARPLAVVVRGPGNDAPVGRRRWSRGADRLGAVEGALQGSLVATYLHGPVLALNSALADLVLSRALGRELEPLHRPEEDVARRGRLARRR